MDQFDFSGYPTINISWSVSRNVKEYREHGYHCVYLSNKHLEALSIFEGDWVCIVVGNREKKNIISCHVASAHLLPGEQKLSVTKLMIIMIIRVIMMMTMGMMVVAYRVNLVFHWQMATTLVRHAHPLLK